MDFNSQNAAQLPYTTQLRLAFDRFSDLQDDVLRISVKREADLFENFITKRMRNKRIFNPLCFVHMSTCSHREASVSRDLSRQFHHRVSGSLSRIQRRRWWHWDRDAPGHPCLHFPAAGSHRVPRRFPWLHRARPHRAVHDGGPRARRLGFSSSQITEIWTYRNQIRVKPHFKIWTWSPSQSSVYFFNLHTIIPHPGWIFQCDIKPVLLQFDVLSNWYNFTLCLSFNCICFTFCPLTTCVL